MPHSILTSSSKSAHSRDTCSCQMTYHKPWAHCALYDPFKRLANTIINPQHHTKYAHWAWNCSSTSHTVVPPQQIDSHRWPAVTVTYPFVLSGTRSAKLMDASPYIIQYSLAPCRKPLFYISNKLQVETSRSVLHARHFLRSFGVTSCNFLLLAPFYLSYSKWATHFVITFSTSTLTLHLAASSNI